MYTALFACYLAIFHCYNITVILFYDHKEVINYYDYYYDDYYYDDYYDDDDDYDYYYYDDYYDDDDDDDYYDYDYYYYYHYCTNSTAYPRKRQNGRCQDDTWLVEKLLK